MTQTVYKIVCTCQTAVELHAGLRVIFDNSQDAFICVHVHSTLFKKDAEKTSRTVALVTDFLLEKIGGLHRDRCVRIPPWRIQHKLVNGHQSDMPT